jgi:hypothetical protein
VRSGRQEEQGVTSTSQNLGKASSLRVLGVLDTAGVRAMVGFVDDDNVVTGPIELVKDPLLLQEVDRHETEGDEVERIRAEFRAPPDFLEFRPVDDFQSKPEAFPRTAFSSPRRRKRVSWPRLSVETTSQRSPRATTSVPGSSSSTPSARDMIIPGPAGDLGTGHGGR